MVTSGTGRNAYTGDPTEWGKTGTTENNGDAWFVGANKDITVAVWVGHADSVKPMLTEYGGAPVDGGTIPALIFNEIVSAYDQLKASEHHRKGGTRDDDDHADAQRSHGAEQRSGPLDRRPRASRARPPASSRIPGARPAAAAREPAAPRGGGAPRAALPRPAGSRASRARARDGPREVLAVRGAEAPRQLRRRG